VWKDLWQRPRHLLDLFTYNHDRPYPDAVLLEPVSFKSVLLGALVLLGLGLIHSLIRRRADRFVGVLVSFGAAVALFLSWQHWPALGRHWTQRDLMTRYFATKQPGEPLGAFLMNWKGETLYTRNEVVQISARDPRGELTALALRPGRAFVLVEHARLGMFQSSLPAGQRVEVLAPETMNKFVLVRIDDP
jgi:hypothetical protein